MWARSAHNLPQSGGSKPEGIARGCEAPERAKRAEPEGLVTVMQYCPVQSEGFYVSPPPDLARILRAFVGVFWDARSLIASKLKAKALTLFLVIASLVGPSAPS